MLNLLREVKEKVNRPFPEKLEESRQIITHHFEEFGDKVGVAFSGGKDSEVVLYLCREVNPDVAVVFNNTGVEYPETTSFVQQLHQDWQLNLTVTKPEKSFWDCIAQYGFPDGKSSSRRCCYWLKEKPALLAIRENGWLGQFTGITAVESYNRMWNAKRKGLCFHYKHWNICKIHPILWWTENEVWDFIKDNGLPLNAIYLRGAKRVGCMPCTAYKDWETQLSLTNPKLYRFIKLRKDGQFAFPV